jgi:hypothetical protein
VVAVVLAHLVELAVVVARAQVAQVAQVVAQVVVQVVVVVLLHALALQSLVAEAEVVHLVAGQITLLLVPMVAGDTLLLRLINENSFID